MALYHRATITPTKTHLVRPRPAIGLTATWTGQADGVVLAEVRQTQPARARPPRRTPRPAATRARTGVGSFGGGDRTG